MNKELLLKSDILDILFEHRNKSYGAYELRRHYENRMRKALLAMAGGVLTFCLFAFIPRSKRETPRPLRYTEHTFADAKLPDAKKPEQKKRTDHKPRILNSNKWVSNIVVVRPQDVKDSLRNLNDSFAIAGNTHIGTPGVTPMVVDPNPVGTDPVEPIKPAITVKPQGPVENPDIMPVYPGGMDALHAFLERNLRNPQDLEEGESVSVHVRFVVGINGKLRGFEPEGTADKTFYQEVVRVLKKMPDWIPGRASGENVSVYYSIPVKFVPAE